MILGLPDLPAPSLTLTRPTGEVRQALTRSIGREPAFSWGLEGFLRLGAPSAMTGRAQDEPRTSPLQPARERGQGLPAHSERGSRGEVSGGMELACATKALGLKWVWAAAGISQHEASPQGTDSGSGRVQLPQAAPQTYPGHPPCACPALTCSHRVRGVAPAEVGGR